MQISIKFFVFVFLIIFSKLTISGTLINDDLKESLEKLYETNPELSYERELLKSKDELMPQALSEFRPKISGYYKKGKVDQNSQGFNFTPWSFAHRQCRSIVGPSRVSESGP